MSALKIPSAAAIERWPWALRALMGLGAACLAQLLTGVVGPLHAFPVAMAFPAIILSAWFLGMWGGVICTLAEAVVIQLFLASTQQRFPDATVPERLRLAIFLVISILLGWTIRRLAWQHTQLRTQELQRRLILAQAEHQVAEERARVSDALREHNEVLQIALAVNDMGLWVWDLEHGTVYCSDEACRMTGREPGSINRLPEEWLQMIHPEDMEDVREALIQTRDRGKDYQRQYRILWPDGSMRWMESRGKCQRDSEGRVTRVVGVLADVTNRKLTEDAMLRTEKLAVAGRLAASVAHEINNPLEAVGNLLYLVSMAKTMREARSHAHMALDELMRVALITQQTLKFHRQTGKPVITRLSEVVAVVLGLFRPKLQAAGITIQVRAVRETGVMCMPSEMHQIFANLVSNAIDAMPFGGRLVVRLRSSHDWRNTRKPGMRVTFSDTGAGIDRATRRRIFDPFFTTKTESGTGLGLWVVAQLVERRRGDVRAWSWQRESGCGSAFSVFLPLGDAANSGARPEAGGD